MSDMDLPIVGAAMKIAEVAGNHAFLTELPRDLEIQDFSTARVLESDWKPLVEEARRALDGHEGRVGIHGPFWGFSIDTIDPDIRTIVQKRLLQGLEVCEALGGTHMVVHSPYSTWFDFNIDNYPDAREMVMEASHAALGPAVKRAENIGTTLVLENIEDRNPFSRVELVKSFNTPALQVSIDTGHAHYAHGATGAPPVDYYVAAAGDLLAHVHLQDADGHADRHWSLGEGTIRWHQVFRALGRLTSNPRLILELKRIADLPGSLAFLQREKLAR